MGKPYAERGAKSTSVRWGRPPYYAYFEHPDGSWYMLWMTRTAPKTRRGHPWHVHAIYDKLGVAKPNLRSRWYEKPYGARNWDFDSQEEAVRAFHRRLHLRVKHGYRLLMGKIPKE